MARIEVFATPYNGNFIAAASLLAHRQLKYTVRRVIGISRRAAVDNKLLEDIYSRIEASAPDPSHFSAESGIVQQALNLSDGNAVEPEWLQAQLAIACFMLGIVSDLELELTSERCLLAAGLYVNARDVTIHGEASRLSIIDRRHQRTIRFSSIGGEGAMPLWVEARRTGSVISTGSAGLAVAGIVHEGLTSVGMHETNVPVDVDVEFQDTLKITLDLLEHALPEFYLWVVPMLRYVCPMKRTGGDLCSSSHNYLPGVVQIATPASASEIAEMIVHECSHQYFNLLARFFILDTPLAKSHYSPLTRSNRPIDRLLVGYHAFVNVELMYERMKSVGLSSSGQGRVDIIQMFLETLESTLDAHVGVELSDIGRLFYETIRGHRPLHRSRDVAC